MRIYFYILISLTSDPLREQESVPIKNNKPQIDCALMPEID